MDYFIIVTYTLVIVVLPYFGKGKSRTEYAQKKKSAYHKSSSRVTAPYNKLGNFQGSDLKSETIKIVATEANIS